MIEGGDADGAAADDDHAGLGGEVGHLAGPLVLVVGEEGGSAPRAFGPPPGIFGDKE